METGNFMNDPRCSKGQRLRICLSLKIFNAAFKAVFGDGRCDGHRIISFVEKDFVTIYVFTQGPRLRDEHSQFVQLLGG